MSDLKTAEAEAFRKFFTGLENLSDADIEQLLDILDIKRRKWTYFSDALRAIIVCILFLIVVYSISIAAPALKGVANLASLAGMGLSALFTIKNFLYSLYYLFQERDRQFVRLSDGNSAIHHMTRMKYFHPPKN